MAKNELPKLGDKISVSKIHVSKMNMRFSEPFPNGEEDEILIANMRTRVRRKDKERVTELISLRPEGDGYGVYKGKRRFEALKIVGVKEFVVGQDCTVRDVTDEEAADASWIENLPLLRKSTDPVTRANKLAERLAFSTLTLSNLAKLDGVGISTYSEWLKVLELTPKMQDALAKGELAFFEGLNVAKLKLGQETQDKLADVLKTQGHDAFHDELSRIPTGKLKRGIPGGVYEIDRVVWDRRNKKEMGFYETVQKAAEKKNLTVPEYEKDYIIRHIDDIAKEAA